MGSKRAEAKPPQYQPVVMDAQGNLYKENPEWRKKMEKLKEILSGSWHMV